MRFCVFRRLKVNNRRVVWFEGKTIVIARGRGHLRNHSGAIANNVGFERCGISQLFATGKVSIHLRFFRRVTITCVNHRNATSVFYRYLTRTRITRSNTCSRVHVRPPFFLRARNIGRRSVITVRSVSLFVSRGATIHVTIVNGATIHPRFSGRFLWDFRINKATIFVSIRAIQFTMRNNCFHARFARSIKGRSTNNTINKVHCSFRPFRVPFRYKGSVVFVFPHGLITITSGSSFFTNEPYRFFIVSGSVLCFFFHLVQRFVPIPIRGFSSIVKRQIVKDECGSANVVIFYPYRMYGAQYKGRTYRIRVRPQHTRPHQWDNYRRNS